MQSEHASTLATALPVPAAVVLYKPEPAILGGLLSRLAGDGHRLLVFVNGPLDEACEGLLAELEDVAIIRSATNIGLGAALNRLVELARDEGAGEVLLMDQDGTPPAGLVAALQRVAAGHRAAGRRLAAIGPFLVPPAGENYRPLRYAWRDRASGAVHFAPTSGSLLSIEAWRAVGPFREDFFIDGLDVEWGLRAFDKGYESIVATEIPFDHRWGTPGQKGKPQILRYPPLRSFYYIRNNVAILRLPHVGWRWKLASAVRLAAQIGLLLSSRRFGRNTVALVRRAVADGWAGRLGPAPARDDLTGP